MKKLGLLLAWLMTFPLAILAQSTSWETATELKPGEQVTYENVKNTSEIDGYFWKFTLTESGTISLKPKYSSSIFLIRPTTNLYYMNESGTHTLLESVNGSEKLTIENAVPGTYCIRMTVNSKLNSYSITYNFTEQGAMVDRKFLVVETKDHVKTTYMLSDKPQVTFEGNSLHIVSEKADATYNLLDIQNFTYETQSVTGVSELREEPATIDYNNGELVVSGLKANGAVSIYAMDGKLVQQRTASRGGTFRLSLSSLPHGVYIVKVGNITYKIMKR